MIARPNAPLPQVTELSPRSVRYATSLSPWGIVARPEPPRAPQRPHTQVLRPDLQLEDPYPLPVS
eukprot:3444252-Rhodomonas_salina.2